MGKMTKIIMACFMLMCFFPGLSPPASSGKEAIGLKFEGQMVSAELEGVSLRLVLEKLGKEKGIWFRGDESVLEESISIRFKDLPLHEGLRRILSGINHVLVFDEEKGLVGLFVLGKKNRGSRMARDAATVTEKVPPPQPSKEDAARKDPFADPFASFPHAAPLDNSRKKSSERTAEISDTPSVPGNLFGENAASSAENPFTTSVFPPAESPSEENIFPGSEDPFSDPF